MQKFADNQRKRSCGWRWRKMRDMLILLTERIVRSIVGANGASVLMSGWLRKAPDCQCDFSEDSASSWSSRLLSVYFVAKSLSRATCTTILPTIFSYPVLRPRLEECRRPAERQTLGRMRPRQLRSQAFRSFIAPSPHSLPGRISCGCSPLSGNNHSSHLAPFA